jgi:demethylmenaquinone methyltransferase/2-methoxy-6-polyprenyl-1,4-benzoquinol methylase
LIEGKFLRGFSLRLYTDANWLLPTHKDKHSTRKKYLPLPIMTTSEQIKPYKDAETGKKEQVAEMFNSISGNYDFLNHFMSLGIDILWRKKAISLLKSSQPQVILDVATGTGDFAIEAIRQLRPQKVIGVDISQGMLDVAKEKITKKGLQDQFEVRLGDSEGLPFEDQSFDAVTVAFGVRNFENLAQGLRDMCRVLKPGGTAVILEFSKPRHFPVKQLYHFYFHKITPFIGQFFSKDRKAYEYLPESVAHFPDGQNFTRILEEVGFSKTKARPQLFGICTIYTAVK